MIVLEGPDGGGKTTLAESLCNTLDLTYIKSEGPEKYPGEIDERILRYHLSYADGLKCLFDRHPCISQMAYSLIHNQSKPSDRLVARFYERRPLLIYCRPNPLTKNPTASGEWDTPEYLQRVNRGYSKLMKWYDEWALWNAHYIYRIGEPIKPIEDLIKGWRRA